MDTGYCRLILRTRPRNCLHLFYSLSIDLSPVTWAQSNHQGACSTESSTQWLPNVDSLCHAHPSTFIFPHENCLLSRMNLYFLNIWRTVFANLFYQIKKGKNLNIFRSIYHTTFEWKAVFFYSGLECKLMQKTAWRSLKKLKMELSQDPAIPLLHMHPEKNEKTNLKRH